MAVSMASFSSQCLFLSSHLKNLSLSSSSSSSSANPPSLHLKPLAFSANLSHSFFSHGSFLTTTLQRPSSRRVVCEAAPAKKADSAVKRARQAETRRLRNKARKSEIRTRMRKVLEALEQLKKKTDAQQDEILPKEKLMAEAYSAIDKAVVKGTLHKNTGANRKSRLARNKKAVLIHHGWYMPDPASVAA